MTKAQTIATAGDPTTRRAVAASLPGRSSSLRQRPTTTRHTPTTSNSSNVEALYSHPNVKIVAFTAGRAVSAQYDGRAGDVEPGSLPSSSQLERTLAIGAFEIYRAPESVAFVRCGSALQPILPKSQCWAIDEQSSCFVLQIRRPTYWRIQLPTESEDDHIKAAQLREVWDKVLQFEKTPCPFQRTFSVDLPKQMETPVVKKPWASSVRDASLGWSPVPLAAGSSPNGPETVRQKSDSVIRRLSEMNLSIPRRDAPRLSEPLPEVSGLEGGISEPQHEAPMGSAGENESHKSTLFVPNARSIFDTPPASSTPVTSLSPVGQEISPLIRTYSADTSDKDSEIVATASAANTESTAEFAFPTPASRDTTAAEDGANGTRVDSELVMGEKEKDSLRPTTDWLSSGLADEVESQEDHAIEGSGSMRLRRQRITAFASRRRSTLPRLSLAASPTTLPTKEVSSDESTPVAPGLIKPAEAPSPAESADSFESSLSWHSPLTPLPLTPPMSRDGSPPKNQQSIGQVPQLKGLGHSRDDSQQTIMPLTPVEPPQQPVGLGLMTNETAIDDRGFLRSEEVASPNADDARFTLAKVDSMASETSFVSAESATTTAAEHEARRNSSLRHRPTTSLSMAHHRPLSPLPPAANLFAPGNFSQRSKLATPSRASSGYEIVKKLPGAIISKTIEILVSPPSHLLNLMLRVAARIAAGEWRGVVFGEDDEGQPIDVRWDWSDAEGDAPEGCEESAYDFKSRRLSRSPKNQQQSAILERAQSPEEDEGSILWRTPAEEMATDDWSKSWGVD